MKDPFDFSPAHAIALKTAEFVTECKAHSLTPADMHELLAAALQEYHLSGSPEKDFLTAIRRQQVINKLSTTCERLRRGETAPVKRDTAKDFKA